MPPALDTDAAHVEAKLAEIETLMRAVAEARDNRERHAALDRLIDRLERLRAELKRLVAQRRNPN